MDSLGWGFGSIRNSGFSFTKRLDGLAKVLANRDLASLGDAYINFAYSLALSKKTGKPSGVKVKGSALAQALRNAGLREYLPSRMTRHALADSAEALAVYGWLKKVISLEEAVMIMSENQELVDGLTRLLVTVRDRITFS
jgi:hypothetical protein